MKRQVKHCMMIMCLVLLFNSISVYAASEKNDVSGSSAQYLSDAAQAYLTGNSAAILETLLNNSEIFNIESSSIENFSFGKPFIIYLFAEKQDEIYYVPVVYNPTQTIVAIVGLINTSKGFTFDIQDSYVSFLNKIDYMNTDAIVYEYGNSLYFETPTTVVKSNNEETMPVLLDADAVEFINGSFEDRLSEVIAKPETFVVNSPQSVTEEQLKEIRLKGDLTLYHPMGQYSYNMCWASTVATIVNYLNSAVVTGYEVCNRMGKGYNDGGTIYDMQDALSKYNIKYSKIRNSMLTWKELVSNIDNKKPIAIGASTSNGASWHATTVYGYSGTSTSTYAVTMWNSNTAKGDGERQVFNYSGGCYSMGGYTYYWQTTLSDS